MKTYDISVTSSRIHDLKKATGRTQNDLAESCGCTVRTFGKYERGEKPVPTDILVRLSEEFNVSTDYLLGLSDFKCVHAEDIGKLTGLNDDAVSVLIDDHQDVKNRLEFQKVLPLQPPTEFQNLAAVINFLLTEGRADRGSAGLLDLLRAYFTTPDDADIEGLPDGISSVGRRGFHLNTAQVAVGMYFSQIQQTLVEYRRQCQLKTKRPDR